MPTLRSHTQLQVVRFCLQENLQTKASRPSANLQKSVPAYPEKKFSKMPHARLKRRTKTIIRTDKYGLLNRLTLWTEKKKNKKHDAPTKYKKHRADKGFREFSALNKLPARLTGNCSECPTIFYTRPLGNMQKK